MRWSASRMMASSCSTTTTVLPRLGQSVKDGNEAIHVSRVQANGWFVEDEERIDE